MNSALTAPGPLAPGGLRVTALGGINEIGRNMTVFEHLGRLLIVDCGVLFPNHDEPGVDLILPDLRHIEHRLEDVDAVVVTHGHEDHIGAIPFLLKLRSDIPIVGSKFTLALVAAKCREHRLKPVLVEVAEGARSTHGVFECQYFAVNHSIPGCLAIGIHTGAGTVLHTGDIKLDQLPPDGRPTDLPGMSRLGDAGVDLFLCDSTNSEIPGVGPSESEVGPALHRLIRGAQGRVIVACFASNVDRVQQIIDASVALGMSYRQRMRRIILPQAFRRMIPPLAGQSIIQMKNTTLLSMITVPDLLYQAGYISSFTYRPMEVYTAVGAIFLIILTPLTMLSRRLERREDRIA